MIPHQDVRLKALAEVALATREKVDRASYVLYLEDTARYSTDVFVEACRRLRTSSAWFPKVAELLDECRIVAAKRAQEAEEARRKQLDLPPVSPEKLGWLRQQLEALVGRKGMR